MLHFWHMAAAEPLGIWITTPDPVRLKGLLYSARAKAKDHSIAHISIRTAPDSPSDTIWLCKGAQEDAS